MAISNRALYVVIKVAEVCNISCSYCYFFYGGDESYKERPRLISSVITPDIVAFLTSAIYDLHASKLTVCLHGGEPLMLGKARFSALCDALVGALSGVVELRIDVQTNGILIDKDWINLFSKFDIGVGLSLDGPATVNDEYRVDKRGRGTHAKTLRGLMQLQNAARQGRLRDPAVICVLGSKPNANALFEYFFDTLGVRAVSFRPPIMNWNSRSESDIEEMRIFYTELVRIWLQRNDSSITIGLFKKMFGLLMTDDGNYRSNHEFPVVVIRSDGALTPYDALSGVDEEYQRTGDTVQTTSLAEFYTRPVWNAVLAGYGLPQGECQKCSWAAMCGGGDIENRYSDVYGFTLKSVYCSSYKAIAAELLDYVERQLGSKRIAERLLRRRDSLLESASPESWQLPS